MGKSLGDKIVIVIAPSALCCRRAYEREFPGIIHRRGLQSSSTEL